MKTVEGVFLDNGVTVFAVDKALYEKNKSHYRKYSIATEERIKKFFDVEEVEKLNPKYDYVYNFIHNLEGSKDFKEQDLRDYAIEVRGLSKTKANKWAVEDIIEFITKEENEFLELIED